MNDTQNVVAWRMRKNDETGWILTESKPMPLNHEEAAWEVQPLYASPQASPPPQPSAQAVMMELEQRLIEIAKALPPMTTLGWNDGGMCEPDEAIKGYTKKQVLEILAQHLSTSSHPEPSAQGEQVATVTEKMVTAYLTANDAYWKRIDGEPTKLGKWRNGTPSEATRVSLMAALASAPSTPPPAVVEAVPQTWPIERAADMLTAYAELVKATGRYAEEHYIPEIENVAAELRGIAPKAAQPVAGAVAEPDCWAILTPNGSKLVSPDEAKGRKDAYPLYAAPQPQAAPAPEPTSDETLTWEKPPSAIEGRLGVWLTSGAELHPRTVNLVVRFARALASKLAAAEAKYGYSDGWASPDWMDECRAKLMEHIAKGDPRDVAAYCAFLWHHGASTARPEPSAQGRPCPFGCTTQEEHDAHQSAEPSAQGEPVAWRPGDPIYDDAYVRGVAVGFAEDDSRRTSLLRIADRIEARASAPSTPPPAVVEAVPLEIDYDALITAAFKRYHYAQGTGPCVAFKRGAEWMRDQVNHGIAPKAAQPNVRVEGRR